jgi:hypothetical protein
MERLAYPVISMDPSATIKAFTMIIAFDIEGCDVIDLCIQYHLFHRDPHLFGHLRLSESFIDDPCFMHLLVFGMPPIAAREIPYLGG